MSDGSDYRADHNPLRIQTEPLRRIGAQDLLKVDNSLYGHLRKQGRFKKLFSSSKWSLKFVVVSQGCVYCFKDEHSENPVIAFSLCAYESVSEINKGVMPHSFEIMHEEKGKPPHVFACETDDKRREWMARIEEVLQQCRTFLGKLSADSGIDEGIPHRKPKLGPLPSVPGHTPPAKQKKYKEAKSEYDLESTDDEGETYDEVTCQDMPTTVAPTPPKAATLPAMSSIGQRVLPPAPGSLQRNNTVSNRPPLPIPPPLQAQQAQHAQKPGPSKAYINNSVFSEDEYVFDSSDRDLAVSYIQGRSVGTFLIRNARSGTGKVLTVNTPIGTKEFRITESGGRVSLDNKEYFPAISALLTYYNQNNLPKSEYEAKLECGYKTLS